MDLAKRIGDILSLDPDANAIEFEGEWRSWGYLREIVDCIDSLLSDAGLEKDAPIGVMLRNRPQHIGALLAIIATRRCLVTLNPSRPAAELSAELLELKLPAIIADAEDWARPELTAAMKELGSLALTLHGDETKSVSVDYKPSEKLNSNQFHAPMPDIAVEMLTSGTTGAPKRIPLPYKNLESSIDATSHYEKGAAGALALKTRATIHWATLVHISGIWTIIKTITDGRPICLLERFNVDTWCAALDCHQPKMVGLPPAAMKMVIDAQVPPEKLQGLRAVRSGTAPLDPALGKQFEDIYGVPVLVVYGATEFAGAVTGWTLKLHQEWITSKRGSVGRAHPGIEMRIVDQESKRELPCDEVGLLEVRAPQLGGMAKDGWVRTNDLARIDEDDFLWIEGRADDAINRGGFKIFPKDVYAVLIAHPSVGEACVVGVADARLGQIPVAAVELKENAAAVSEKELADFCRSKLTGYQCPVKIRIVDALPRTPSLKVRQADIVAMFRQ